MFDLAYLMPAYADGDISDKAVSRLVLAPATNVNAPGECPKLGKVTPIEGFAAMGATKTVRSLLSKADVDPKLRFLISGRAGINAVRLACENGHTETAKVLVADRRIDVDALLPFICGKRNEEVLKAALEREDLRIDEGTLGTVKAVFGSPEAGASKDAACERRILKKLKKGAVLRKIASIRKQAMQLAPDARKTLIAQLVKAGKDGK